MKRKKNGTGTKNLRQRWISMILVCILAIGAIAIPVQVLSREEEEVSDYFYIQIYDDSDQVVSKYKVTLTGIFSNPLSRKITDVAFHRESGDVCQTFYEIDGYNVTVRITHPTEGYFEKFFVLGSNGRFF